MTIFMRVLSDLYKNGDSLNMSCLTCMENPVFPYVREFADLLPCSLSTLWNR